MMIVMEAFGRGLVVEPYLATVVLGGGFLRLGGSEAQRERLIPKVADGSLTLAFAHLEGQARYDLHDVATTARRTDGGGFLLDGAKGVVLHGGSADLLVVSARTSGARRDREGITLFLVDPKAPGVTRRDYPTQDGLRAAEVTLDGVRVEAGDVLGELDRGLPLVERVVDLALAAVCAEAVGAMEALQRLTVEYLKTRQQSASRSAASRRCSTARADMLVAVGAGPVDDDVRRHDGGGAGFSGTPHRYRRRKS
jgi:alkylation response protein AidB-like acyl-CoA dehydrogenase